MPCQYKMLGRLFRWKDALYLKNRRSTCFPQFLLAVTSNNSIDSIEEYISIHLSIYKASLTGDTFFLVAVCWNCSQEFQACLVSVLLWCSTACPHFSLFSNAVFRAVFHKVKVRFNKPAMTMYFLHFIFRAG